MEQKESISAMSQSSQVPSIFLSHIGTWQGEYIKTDATGNFLRSFLGTFTVSITGNQYRQVNHYQYPDGKTMQLNFAGEFTDGILKIASDNYESFEAIAWDSGKQTIGFRVRKTQNNHLITYWESIILITPQYRVRSTQEYKDGIFEGINFIQEQKLSEIV